ncbi:PREDICTED: serine/arginine repetitive matrix protein 2-like [Eufriesea mexicana]|uniref:serine/arginine repetitive matrix protein 2-like n=1 Tax=Eufriesea mexicana TaxID=516756 RepID=UPI00083C3DAA|nr:PREDICTED: serine/arginine repetitive matrix protein 2-like [Eufriesea mexicana]
MGRADAGLYPAYKSSSIIRFPDAKVRQMFDERRQTTVKGIDRSYPLEPLENKPRKQSNGNGVQKNGNLTVNRQSVTVKRVARADVNSNLNGGKPVVSYHEEITRESFGPSARQQEDDEFGNENHVARYANGNHPDETHIEEVLDDDMIERNRMMAKLHLMEYDETLKHRVKNDLESEEFPEDFMVDVPDKLPKQSVTKKLSQAEARLERFKNANAKRGNSVTKNTTIASKKRSDPIFPAKSSCSQDRVAKTRTREVSDRGSRKGDKSPGSSRPRAGTVASETVQAISDSERSASRTDGSPRFFCKESEKSATTYATDSKTRTKLSNELRGRTRRSESPKLSRGESEKSIHAVDPKTAGKFSPDSVRDETGRSNRFFCKESEKSATTYAVDSRTDRRLSSEALTDVKRRSDSPKSFTEESGKSTTTRKIDSKTAKTSTREISNDRKDVRRRSKSPKFFSERPEESGTIYATDSKTPQRLTRQNSKDITDFKRRSESPKFFCKESEKSATTYAIDSKIESELDKSTREVSKIVKDVKRRSESPKYAIDSKTPQRLTRQNSKHITDFKRRSESPKFFYKESEKSATTYAIDSKIESELDKSTREVSKTVKDVKRRSESPKYAIDSKDITDFKRRSESPKFFFKESEKSATTYAIDSKIESELDKSTREVSKIVKDVKRRSESPKYAIDSKTPQRLTRQNSKHITDFKRRSESPKFFCKESEKSATTYAIDSETGEKFSPDFSKARKPRSSTPKFLCEGSEKSENTYIIDSRSHSTSPDYMKNTASSVLKIEPRNRKNIIEQTLKDSVNDTVNRHIETVKSSSPESLEYDVGSYAKPETQRESKSTMSKSTNVFERLTRERSSSPRFLCEGTKSATTMSFDSRDTSKSPSFVQKSMKKRSDSSKIHSTSGKHQVPALSTAKSRSPDFAKSFRKSNTSPQFFPSYSADRSATIMMVTPETISKSKTQSVKPNRREQGPVSSFSNAITEPWETSTVESNDASSRHFIRSSVSRFFSEQCEKALRNLDTGNHVRSKPVKKHHPTRSSSPLSLKDMRTPSPTDRSRSYHERDTKTDRSSIDRGSSRESSPRSRKLADSREGTPEFFSYGSEKSTMTVKERSINEQSSSKAIAKEPLKNSRSITQKASPKSRSPTNGLKIRLSKSPDSQSTVKSAITSNRRGSGNVLRSTKLIRDAMRCQSDRNQVDCAPERQAKGSLTISGKSMDTDGISDEWKLAERSRDEVDRKVDERAGSPAAGELAVTEPSGKSCAEVDTGIEEITMPDRYIKQEQSRGTYSRSSNKTSAGGEKSSVEKLFTYSVHGPVKQRGSLFESSVFERSLEDRTDGGACDSDEEERISPRHAARNSSSRLCSGKEAVVRGSKRRAEDVAREKSVENISRCRGGTGSRKMSSRGTIVGKSSKERRDISKLTRSTVDQSAIRASKRTKANIADTGSAVTVKISKTRDHSTSPLPRARKASLKGTVSNETKKRRPPSPANIPKSMELVRRAMTGSNLAEARTQRKMATEVTSGVVKQEQIEITRSSSTSSTMIEIRESGSGEVSIKEGTSSGRNYERTDSVESALRRFDSIGTEAGSESVHGSLDRGEESITWKRQTESGKTEGSGDDTKTISLKALDRPDVNLSRGHGSKPSKTPSRKAATAPRAPSAEGRVVGKLTRCEKKFAKARDSIEIARIVVRSKSPACRGMLFKDADSGEETETESWRSRCRLGTTMSDEKQTGEPGNNASRRFESGIDDEVSIDVIEKGKMDDTSTGADRCLSVKQLRSIEDIRKSIVGESWDRKATGTSRKSVIARNARRGSSAAEVTEAASARSEPRRINIDDRAGNRKEISLPRRSGNVDARKDALGNTARSSVKCAMRFSRVAKSPSPETTKATETSSRARRNVPASPSKSPDTVARRPSTELKAQDTKSTKRPTPMKGTEPIGNRKTTTTTTMTTTTTTAATTSTSTRKSTDVVDGAILENGLHLRDQTAETKYDNDSPTTKKSDAFVIDFDEQPPKENDAPLPRKPLYRKQSTEKQIPSTQSVRPPSSVSSTSSASSVQGQVSGSRGKMASRAKTPISGSTPYKGSAGSKSGGGAAAVESLVACKVCGRRFAQDRVSLHEQICAKTGQKKRKQFDAMIYRVRGTDIEPFFKKGLVKKQLEKSKKPEVKSNWRRKHEDFINAIRSAKQVQAHLAAGGKLSDLPPPPVSDNCDYIQCPHCGRKFNKAAAERHIPKCEHMLHNKPIHSRAPKPRR